MTLNTRTPKKRRSKVRAAPGTNTRAVTLGARYGPQFDDLDAINTHFANTATDPDYDIDDINAIRHMQIDTNGLTLTLYMNTRFASFCLVLKELPQVLITLLGFQALCF